MLNYTHKPIEEWPGVQTKNRRASKFTTPYGKILALLEKELTYLGASNVVFQIAMDWDQLRNDGRPRAGAKARHPGVIVSFNSRKKGPLSFPCDTFVSFEDNLYAIALTLGKLRDIDRYGVTQNAEQYKGWKALPEKSLSSENAAQTLAHYSGYDYSAILKDSELRESAYKLAARSTHPDHNGGDNEKFLKVQEAINLLRNGAQR